MNNALTHKAGADCLDRARMLIPLAVRLETVRACLLGGEGNTRWP